MIEKAIYCKCLPEPDISVLKAMLSKIIVFWRKNGILNSEDDITRKIKFIHNFGRSLTIIFAIEKFCNDPNSEGFNKTISFKNLEKIKKYLFCTEEIATFICSLLSPRLINGGASHLLQCFFASYKTRIIRDTETCDPTVDSDGFYSIITTHSSRMQFFSALVLAQGSAGLTAKLSPENLKVAFNYMARTSFKGRCIAFYDDARAMLFLNKDYVLNFFDYNKIEKNFVIKKNYMDPALFAIQKAYNHAHTNDKRTFITGQNPAFFLPFLLRTFQPKKNKIFFQSHVTNHNFLNDESPANITFPKDFELTCFQNFCNENQIMENDLNDLYSNSCNAKIVSKNYPNEIKEKYLKSHNINEHNGKIEYENDPNV